MVASMSLECAELKTKIASTTLPPPVDNFMATNDFLRYLSQFIPVQDLLRTFRLVCKQWRDVAEEIIGQDVESGELMIHDGKDVMARYEVLQERRKLVTRVVFLLNITKVGRFACIFAANLVVVDIPEGVDSIDDNAFEYCSSLTNVSFPTKLTSIGAFTVAKCSSLDNVDLRHTNLQELGNQAFYRCSELKTMTIPDSLQTLGAWVFCHCLEIFPFSIIVTDNTNELFPTDTASEVVAYLRSQQT
ncbi:hypothetical protein TL16_g03117 [Triparma laevis f. inornata]|uniref:Uncharacterized protein n=1 Tax=Triparma laevis f. inornata TaxID=1714386 RepID=A0A9W7DZT4_9STRA|nr:hypothetical protein TL16_g03117 [Triparma laevis f. inornata]